MTQSALPTDAAKRKEFPIYSGFIVYFPHAIAAVANLSFEGQKQHHPDKPLHWDMNKSSDELDALMRHIIDEDWAQVAWRGLANLERKLTGNCQYENFTPEQHSPRAKEKNCFFCKIIRRIKSFMGWIKNFISQKWNK